MNTIFIDEMMSLFYSLVSILPALGVITGLLIISRIYSIFDKAAYRKKLTEERMDAESKVTIRELQVRIEYLEADKKRLIEEKQELKAHIKRGGLHAEKTQKEKTE